MWEPFKEYNDILFWCYVRCQNCVLAKLCRCRSDRKHETLPADKWAAQKTLQTINSSKREPSEWRLLNRSTDATRSIRHTSATIGPIMPSERRILAKNSWDIGNWRFGRIPSFPRYFQAPATQLPQDRLYRALQSKVPFSQPRSNNRGPEESVEVGRANEMAAPLMMSDWLRTEMEWRSGKQGTRYQVRSRQWTNSTFTVGPAHHVDVEAERRITLRNWKTTLPKFWWKLIAIIRRSRAIRYLFLLSGYIS